MANVLVDETSLQNIASTIRTLGGINRYKPSEMAGEIKNVYNSRVALEKKFSSNSKFWDVLQDSGNRTDYSELFMYFTDSNFKPKYDMSPTKATSMFEYSNITDLTTLLNNKKVQLNLRGLTTLPYRMFAFSTITRCPSIIMPSSRSFDLNCMFYDCKQLKTIDGLLVSANYKFTYTFNGCSSLQDITFEVGAEIGNNIAFKSSPLSRQSIESIIHALSDNVTGKTLTLKQSAVNNAFVSSDEQVEWNDLINSKPNWTISLF